MPGERDQQNSLAAIQKNIGVIGRSANKLNEQIHLTAVMCFEHARMFGDVLNTAAKLVDAMPLSHRRSLLINWFEQFSPITVAKDAKSGNMKAHLRGTAEEREALWNLEAAKATPFYAMPEAEREPDIPTYESVHDNIIAFVKRMDKKANEIANAEDKDKALAEIGKLRVAIAK